ncbi:MAG: hypothetical protein ACI9OS_000429 [Ulvibacter sp.]
MAFISVSGFAQPPDIEWKKTLLGTDFEIFRPLQHTTEAGYTLTGSTRSSDGDVTANHGGLDFWVVKLGSDLGVDENELKNSIILSPNPNTGKFTLSFSEEISVTSIKVINASGRTIYSEKNTQRGTFEIDQNFTAGVYFVKVTSIASQETLKMIVD